MSLLTDEQWGDLIRFYHDGHTMKECGVRFGISQATVQRYFAKYPDIPRRPPLQKSRPRRAKARKARPEVTPPVGSAPAPRKIVSLREEWKEIV